MSTAARTSSGPDLEAYYAKTASMQRITVFGVALEALQLHGSAAHNAVAWWGVEGQKDSSEVIRPCTESGKERKALACRPGSRRAKSFGHWQMPSTWRNRHAIPRLPAKSNALLVTIGLLSAHMFLLVASLVAIMSMPMVKMHAARFRLTTTHEGPIDK